MIVTSKGLQPTICIRKRWRTGKDGWSEIRPEAGERCSIEGLGDAVIARLEAILLTIALTILFGSALGCMFAGDFIATSFGHVFGHSMLLAAAAIVFRLVAWIPAASLLALSFAFLYYREPDWIHRRWRWLTPGTITGAAGWLLASFGLRVYLHFLITTR